MNFNLVTVRLWSDFYKPPYFEVLCLLQEGSVRGESLFWSNGETATFIRADGRAFWGMGLIEGKTAFKVFRWSEICSKENTLDFFRLFLKHLFFIGDNSVYFNILFDTSIIAKDLLAYLPKSQGYFLIRSMSCKTDLTQMCINLWWALADLIPCWYWLIETLNIGRFPNADTGYLFHKIFVNFLSVELWCYH